MNATDESEWLRLADEHATPPTAKVLRERAADEPAAAAPRFLSDAQYATLRAVIDRLVPQSGERRVEIAAVIDRNRADGVNDGWRFEALPPDGVALRIALDRLNLSAHARHHNAFVDLSPAEQDGLLAAVQRGDVDWAGFAAATWFAELLGEAVEIFVAHPKTLASLSFTGLMFAKGWSSVGLNAAEPWEPAAR